MKHNILLSGVGGQGTVLASKLIAQCALAKNIFVRTAETIGMAQRGGSVVSHVRIGENVYSPLIPMGGAQLIIGFEPAEAVRVLPYLAKNGAIVVNTTAIKPVTDALSSSDYRGDDMLKYLKAQVPNLIQVDGADLVRKFGMGKELNLALIGVACGHGLLGFNREDLLDAIEQIVPKPYIKTNNAVFLAAYNQTKGE